MKPTTNLTATWTSKATEKKQDLESIVALFQLEAVVA